jgi:hypothetical protein
MRDIKEYKYPEAIASGTSYDITREKKRGMTQR